MTIEIIRKCDNKVHTTEPRPDDPVEPQSFKLPGMRYERFLDLHRSGCIDHLPYSEVRDLVENHGIVDTVAPKNEAPVWDTKVQPCLLCTDTFASSTTLTGHLQTRHSLGKNWAMNHLVVRACPFCSHMPASMHGLSLHLAALAVGRPREEHMMAANAAQCLVAARDSQDAKVQRWYAEMVAQMPDQS